MITPCFVLCWLGILIVMGGHFGSHGDQNISWQNHPYGVSIPYTCNTMPCNTFNFMHSYVHFEDYNQQICKKDHGKHDVLYKIRYVSTCDEMDEVCMDSWFQCYN